MRMESPSFRDGDWIPVDYSVDGGESQMESHVVERAVLMGRFQRD
ncbi:hypothetical protein ACIOHS_43590 [Streptomyces sp. NPDC088253]